MPSDTVVGEPAVWVETTGALSLRIWCCFGDAAIAVFGLIVDAVCEAGVHLLAQRSSSIARTLGDAAVRSLQHEAEQHVSAPPAKAEVAETRSPATSAIAG